MAESRVKRRVEGLLGGGMPANAALPDPRDAVPDQREERVDPAAQRALQVLVLAQRTADDHVAAATQQAEAVRAEAQAAAEQIARNAQAQAEGARREGAQALAEARAMAEQLARNAQAHAEGARRDAEKVLSDARAQAQEIGKDAQASAAGLELEAQQRYDDVVGGLAAKRDALQQQIDALHQFDRDYRARLRRFMQDQMRALGVDEPPPNSLVTQAQAVRSGGDGHPGMATSADPTGIFE